ncbi:MAG: hypothetical protein PHF86_12975 [Candidatus Nanoarchaeia archaeon]|nr:hypothetical protein [Candidatus Nanoarchaeia archaeon]
MSKVKKIFKECQLYVFSNGKVDDGVSTQGLSELEIKMFSIGAETVRFRGENYKKVTDEVIPCARETDYFRRLVYK